MGTEVDHGSQPTPYLGIVKAQHLSPGLLQRLQKLSLQLLGAQSIHQQTHLHACTCLLDQQITQGRAGLIGLVDVVLQMHMVACCAHGIGNRIKGRSATHQQLHGSGRAYREIAGHANQPCHLTQALLLGRNAFPEFLHAVAHTRTLARAQPLDTLALHALRTEVVIDQQTHHR